MADGTYEKQLKSHIKSLEISAESIVDDMLMSDQIIKHNQRLTERYKLQLAELEEQIKLAKFQLKDFPF